MQMPHPLTRDLVLIGGGHAHAVVLLHWGMSPLPGVRLTLINPGPTAPYSGMLPGHIAGHYSRDDLDIDLVKLARFAGARLILAPATGIDPQTRQVMVEGRGAIGYDVASIDVGIHARMPGITGFAEHALGAKPLDIYASRWQAFLAQVDAGEKRPEVAVIGGGIAGVELAMAMAHALRRTGRTGGTGGTGRDATVSVIDKAVDLTGSNAPARQRLKTVMAELGVDFHGGVTVSEVCRNAVQLSNGTLLPAQFVVGAAGGFAHEWLAQSPLPLTDEGFVMVDAHLRVAGSDYLFAVGDCAHMSDAPRPKAGVFAVRAGPVLAGNLRAVLSGGQTRAFKPQKNYLKLVSLGGKSALAEKWGLALAGPLLWRWKDRIDQKFMDMFRHLPQMPLPALAKQSALGLSDHPALAKAPLCGGCGSKVGAGTLARSISKLPQLGRADVLSGPGDDAAVLSVGGAKQVISTDHLRAFTHDAGLMARIAAVHALGDIWSMGAMPQVALASVTLPRMSPELQARSLDEIMAAAGEVFANAGAEIVGGHTSMGAEMTIGFTVTGLSADTPIGQGGGRPGDLLILTRPIGSGTILAAEMAGQANGGDVAQMLATMALPQDDAASILRDAHAMTDVTGFGLAGHLLAICRASGVGAEIRLQDVPLYHGALELAEQGHRSTIYHDNLAAAPVSGATGTRAALLHDPQTAGGMLAAIAPDQAKNVLNALRQTGCQAAIIGQLVAGAPVLSCG